MRAINHSVITALLIMSVYLLCASIEPAQAKLFKWKDDSGASHYTDNENNIPLKYRNKDKIEKLKGISRPRPIESQDPENPENPDSEILDEEIIPAEGDSGGGADNETLAFLKEIKTYLETDIKLTRKTIKEVPPDVKNGKYIILPLLKGAQGKLDMAEKIKQSKIKALKPVQQYLVSSAAIDQTGVLGGDDYLARVIETKDRIEREVEVKEKLLKMVDQEINNAK